MKGRETNEKGGEGKVGETKEGREKKREGIGPPTFSNLPPPMEDRWTEQTDSHTLLF
jgi:hypothetical protein